MTYVKERNFIVCYDNNIKLGAWNITDGSFLGKSGKLVKGIPACFNNISLSIGDKDDYLYRHAVKTFREYWNNDYNVIRGNRFEQLISVGLFPNSIYDLDYIMPLNKDLVKYLKENNRGIFDKSKVQNYIARVQYHDFLCDKPEWVEPIFAELITELPYEYLKTIINRIIIEHAEYFYDNKIYYGRFDQMKKLIKRYYQICMALYGKVEIKPNILSNYAKLTFLEQEYKNAHYDEILNNNNNRPWLLFENENYIVIPLTSKKEFHNEARAQNNCVESMYMEYVFDGKTHVVSIRRKNKLREHYITCEVANNGEIIQYLKKNNDDVTEEEDINFRNLYQNHLRTVEKD